MNKKTALITGAAGDIGFCVATKLSQLGYNLILTDIDVDKLDSLYKDFTDIEKHKVDLSNRSELALFQNKISNEYGHINLAFINAGMIIVGDVLELSEEEIDLQLELNLRSAIHLIKTCATNMVKYSSGHIITTVSMGGIVGLKGSAIYSTTKFGLRGYLMSLRDELIDKGVRVTGIYPSGVDTQMLRYEARSGGSNLNFVSQPISVDSVANAVLKSLKSNHLEVYLPYSESISARFLSLFPWLLKYLYPSLEKLGQRGLKKYLNKIEID